MRITKRQLRRIIKEEKLKLVHEQSISRGQGMAMDRELNIDDYDETLSMFEKNFPYELEKFINNMLSEWSLDGSDPDVAAAIMKTFKHWKG